MAVFAGGYEMPPSGNGLMLVPLWRYYPMPVDPALGPQTLGPQTLGPGSSSDGGLFSMPLVHVGWSAVGGVVSRLAGRFVSRHPKTSDS